MKYPKDFIEQTLVKVHSRGDRTLREIAAELGVNFYTIQRWLKVRKIVRTDVAGREKRPDEWQRDEQLAALLETHGLSEDQVSAWCRERGLFPHHLQEWKAGFCAADSAPAKPASDKALNKEIAKLKKELNRKDKALAETAALLVLQKKFQALWADEEK